MATTRNGGCDQDMMALNEDPASLPETFMKELRIRASLVKEIGRHVEWDTELSDPSLGRMRGPCPFCAKGRGGEPTLQADDVTGEFRCLACGVGGDVTDFIGMVERPPIAGFRYAAERVGMGMPEPDPRTPVGIVRRRERLLKANRVAAGYFQLGLRGDDGKAAREWLAARTRIDDRRLSWDNTDWWRIGFAPNTGDGLVNRLRRFGYPDGIILATGLAETDRSGSGRLRDRFRNMVTFDIRESEDRYIGFSAQSMDPAGRARHIVNPDTELFSRDSHLLNLDRIDARPGMARDIFVGRSGLDAMALQAVAGPAVASFDHGLTVGQMDALWRVTDCIVIAVPNIPEARAGAFRTLDLALPLITGERRLRFVILRHTETVADFVSQMGERAAKAILTASWPFLEMLLLREREGLDLDLADHRNALYERVRRRLREIGDPETQYRLHHELDDYAKTAGSGCRDLSEADTCAE